MRLAMGIEYDGRCFFGWQFQKERPSVQQVVEQAISFVANTDVNVVCAGRTDTGVHAVEQVIHFDTDVQRDEYAWLKGTNANLPKSVSVLWVKQVNEGFHARFNAERRRYRYVIFNRDVRPAFLAGRVSWDYRQLDETKMQAAANTLLGEHDFNAYRTVACQAKSPVRNLIRLDVSRNNELIFLDVEANAFLHHMVRNLAGVLMSIGAGEQPVSWAWDVLQTRDRRSGGITASPDGLYLMKINYPVEYNLPQSLSSSAVW
jgi:tRNA pseudouridine38-40 synthase